MAGSPSDPVTPAPSPGVDRKSPAFVASSGEIGPGEQARLVAALREPARHGPDCTRVDLLETHISYVLLTGKHAYKIKKAIALEFLDFRTLAARRFYCDEELRLNRRLAPALYECVVPITGLPDAPQLGGAGAVLDYAVRMREFPQQMLLSAMLDRQEVDERRIDELAAEVARFHGSIDVAPPESPYGDAEDELALALDNIDALLAAWPDPAIAGTLDTLRRWTERTFASIRSRLDARRREGFVRECHGDLHLGNIAVVDGRIAIFDCIDFNARMRWNDLMGEVAFLAMDLEYRGRADLADRFVNRYMEATGDYAGAAVLRFFVVYRAMVRAKVEALRVAQMPDGAERAWLATECREYVALARAWAEPPHPAMVAMHGLSGSGKTTVSDAITAPLGALRVRTDVERKRLHGLAATASSGSGTQSGLYAEDATRAAYRRVLDLAHEAIAGGFTVVADGAFLHRWQRDLFRSAAASLGVPFAILSVRGHPATLERRIAARARASTDASEADAAVLAHQLLAEEPLADDEVPRVVVWNGERPVATLRSSPEWARLVALIGDPEATRAGPEHPGVPVAQEAVVEFLSRPSSHAEGGTRVETIETHWSWVFVTGNRAVKIKKAIRTEFADLRRVTARRRNCVEEVRLNRRLSHDVYLGTRPLLADAGGTVSFSTGAQAVDWAVEDAPPRARADARSPDRRTARCARQTSPRSSPGSSPSTATPAVTTRTSRRIANASWAASTPTATSSRARSTGCPSSGSNGSAHGSSTCWRRAHGSTRGAARWSKATATCVPNTSASTASRRSSTASTSRARCARRMPSTTSGSSPSSARDSARRRSVRRSSTATGTRAATMRRRPSCASTRACVRACVRGSRSGTCASRRWHRIPCGVNVPRPTSRSRSSSSRTGACRELVLPVSLSRAARRASLPRGVARSRQRRAARRRAAAASPRTGPPASAAPEASR